MENIPQKEENDAGNGREGENGLVGLGDIMAALLSIDAKLEALLEAQKALMVALLYGQSEEDYG